jgi:hypothetical protein
LNNFGQATSVMVKKWIKGTELLVRISIATEGTSESTEVNQEINLFLSHRHYMCILAIRVIGMAEKSLLTKIIF